MPDRVLTLRELNRATLARQMLLERAALPVPAAIERLVGLQAQVARPPYIGLWTRLPDFRRDDLALLIENRTVVKATLMRATLHVFTAADYTHFRTTLQPALTDGWNAVIKKRNVTFDMDTLLAQGHRFIAEQPRTFAEISAMVTAFQPDQDVGAMRYAIRTRLPLVQVPINTGWSYSSNPAFTLAETWLEQSIASEDHFRDLAVRYLAAFGPASAADMQSWSGLPKLKSAFEKLKPDLVTYRDEGRRELFDLPNTPLPGADSPAPPRFLPEFDNLLLGHDKRTRVIADEHRKKVYLPGLRVAATILVDGFVGGVWKVEKTKKAAALVIEPFAPLAKPVRDALTEEGERLVRFAEPDAQSFDVRFAE